MAAIYELSIWLDGGNAPESAEDAADLERTLLGQGQGRYKCQPKDGGEFNLVTGPGEKAFLFRSADADTHVAFIRERYQSEPGASLDGDAEFERAMQKDD